MKAHFKFLIILDRPLKGSLAIQESVKLLQDSIQNSADGDLRMTYDIVVEDLSIVGWQDSDDDRIPAWSYMNMKSNEYQKKYGHEYQFLMFMLDEPNWQGKYYTGIHRGTLYMPNDDSPKYTFLFLRYHPGENSAWLAKVMSMEFVHSFDQWGKILDPDIDLDDIFSVSDYDEDVIHGRDSRYPRYEYAHVYKKLKDLLIKWFPYEEGIKEDTMRPKILINTTRKEVPKHGERINTAIEDSFEWFRDRGVDLNFDASVGHIQLTTQTRVDIYNGGNEMNGVINFYVGDAVPTIALDRDVLAIEILHTMWFVTELGGMHNAVDADKEYERILKERGLMRANEYALKKFLEVYDSEKHFLQINQGPVYSEPQDNMRLNEEFLKEFYKNEYLDLNEEVKAYWLGRKPDGSGKYFTDLDLVKQRIKDKKRLLNKS